MIFYAKDFSILPDSEIAEKYDTVFSEKEAKIQLEIEKAKKDAEEAVKRAEEAKKKALEAKKNAENIK